jgi:nitrogen fixation/metabolism regulation signal transduction histidine kinase
LIFSLIPSVGLASFLAGLLTLVIGLLLLSRLIGPLAEVIGAAQAVAGDELLRK